MFISGKFSLRASKPIWYWCSRALYNWWFQCSLHAFMSRARKPYHLTIFENSQRLRGPNHRSSSPWELIDSEDCLETTFLFKKRLSRQLRGFGIYGISYSTAESWTNPSGLSSFWIFPGTVRKVMCDNALVQASQWVAKQAGSSTRNLVYFQMYPYSWWTDSF